jgi:hypothetical protein
MTEKGADIIKIAVTPQTFAEVARLVEFIQRTCDCGGPQLVCIAGKHAGKEFPVKDRMRIGRLDTCEIVISHDDVSREHATLRREGERWVVQDLGSRNGTAVNGERRTKAPLQDGDQISLGDMILRFVDEAAPDPPPATADERGDSGAVTVGGESHADEALHPSDGSGGGAAARVTPCAAPLRPPPVPERGFAFEAGLSASQRQTLENVLFLIVWALTFFCVSILTQVLLRVITV